MKKILTSVLAIAAVATFSAQESVNGVVAAGQTKTLKAGVDYRLTGSLTVEEGGTLVLEPGTIVKSNGATEAYVVVKQGGKIFSNGTEQQPVIFTSANAQPKNADWGGIVIAGRAPINIGAPGASGTTEVANVPYGGSDVADNSGSITYTKILYSGARFNEFKEYNGLSLFGVGNGTVINNVSIINGADDGIEMFGGTVNMSNIYLQDNEDDAFDWTEGWTGTATNVYSVRNLPNVGNRGIEADNNSKKRTATPMSNPTLKNITFIGQRTTDNEGAGTNLFRVGSGGTVDNAIFAGWADGVTLQHDETIVNFTGLNKFTNIKFVDNERNFVIKPNAGGSIVIEPNTGYYTINEAATGAGNGLDVPAWAASWALLGASDVAKFSTSVKVVPSVVSSEFTVVTDKKVNSVEVVDMAGRSVLKASGKTVNANGLAKGTYVVKVQTAEGETATAKIIKK
ncbi:Por secretion system C-terminal sorting domain-containing protein [Cruoricaptor ignavus]|uniref:Por secretion system C-terminal sorting domain-containing protein n=1 Tax=Cruoricaptor ignavus TaxID=1118202 RepID=A0A1M6GY98_9FLAO|nr:T9SS type A sorting domain-containing protein [Cruoricaptor ignavus]SHJ14886.1 Por secretion system C-terminal sorting domain-containing protein [Cruoricaptor ignavus]